VELEDDDEEDDGADSEGFDRASAGGKGGISAPPGDGISYGVVGTGFAAEAPAELLDDDVSALALALALTLAADLLAAFPLADDLAAWAGGHGNSIMAGKIAKAVKHRTKLEHLGVMAGLSNAKLTAWSSTGGRGARQTLTTREVRRSIRAPHEA
jgi:hypothetical protein